MIEIPGSGNLISLLPPDGILERSPAGPENEEILGLMIIVMMMWMGMMWWNLVIIMVTFHQELLMKMVMMMMTSLQ